MKRESFLDIAKGIAAIFVIMGHCNYTNSMLNVWIYSFHMPLFFVISGILIIPNKYLSLKEITRKKIKALIIPYLILSIISYILLNILETLKTGRLDLSILLKRFLGIIIEWVGTDYYCGMWFILTLFFSSIISYLIVSLIENLHIKEYKKNIFLIISFIVIYILGFIIIKYVKGFLWCLNFVPFSIAYVILGYILKRINKSKKIFSNKILIIPMMIMNIMFCYLNYKIAGKSDIYFSNLGNIFYYLVASITGTILVILISKIIKKNNILETFGKHSFIYYALQGCLALPISKFAVEIFFNKFKIPKIEILMWILIIGLSICILEVSCRILEKLLPKIFKKT